MLKSCGFFMPVICRSRFSKTYFGRTPNEKFMTHNDIVQKLWNLCDVLRDDGINYSDYVTELVLLLFIKMVHENTE
ncbi:type I restriction-modification system subunit M N-terminal domain-containing protein, partial [Oceanospirillum linum]|uniref:type I restriction-modification system subunit M N-terminal domain-containing protein n=1 Tax=Oceanospirillum linum TaxID=966 RepID=UPI003083A5EB